MRNSRFIFILSLCFLVACSTSNVSKKGSADSTKTAVKKNKTEVPVSAAVADVASILAKKQVSVLCYHHIRELKPGQGETMKSYFVFP